MLARKVAGLVLAYSRLVTRARVERHTHIARLMLAEWCLGMGVWQTGSWEVGVG